MSGRRLVITVAAAIVLVAGGLVVRNQIRVQRNRQARDAEMQRRHAARPVPSDVHAFRQALFDALQPVALKNCTLQRFGEAHDGGYLMCANLLDAVHAGYSYGINGYDKWGCDISKARSIPVHQYDCFNLERPSCKGGQTVFHEECVGARAETQQGRVFDSVASQFQKNGDAGKRIVMKIDVEGAEWDTFLAMPDATFAQIDQMAVEFHWDEGGPHGWVSDPRYVNAVNRLKQFFEVAHIHHNNNACVADLAPFPAWAFEVLFVNKRLAQVDPSARLVLPNPADAPNRDGRADCQAPVAAFRVE